VSKKDVIDEPQRMMYKGIVDCAIKTYQFEGLTRF
jgi:hypothetical protein